MSVDLSTRYFDHEVFLPRVKWLVERAAANLSEGYSRINNHLAQCKMCGALVSSDEQAAHVQEHAVKLRVKMDAPTSRRVAAPKPAPVDRAARLLKEVEETIFDTLTEGSWELQLFLGRGVLAHQLSSAMIHLISEDRELESSFPLCLDCTDD